MDGTGQKTAISFVLLIPILAATLAAARFEPDDPLFSPDMAGHHQGQWYLRQAGFPEAWQEGAAGRGVTIGIVDTKFGLGHPDLEPARRHGLDGDFRIEIPGNLGFEDIGWSHGLMVAGVAAARGGNGIGICGAAPLAGLAWIHSGGPEKLEDMIRHDPDPGKPIRVRNYSIGITSPFHRANRQGEIRRAFRETAESGTLHVISAGNAGGWEGGDCGKSILSSTPHVIVVAACDHYRRTVTWSSHGGAVVACAPSAEPGSSEGGIMTVADAACPPLAENPSMTASFGGTSAAAPQVSGLMALGVEVIADLEVRLAKHLLARTCLPPVDESPDQVRNASGQWHSPGSGFGMIHAGRFIALAQRRPKLSPLILEPARDRDDVLGLMPVKVEADLPDGDLAGMTRTFTVASGVPLEEVEISLDIRHRDRGQLSAWLQSPSGTRRELFSGHFQDQKADLSWIFVTHAFWGEDPQGEWKITVADGVEGETGHWTTFGWRMRMGRLIDL